MGTFLRKAIDLWSDLEKSYELTKSKGPKKEFLLRLCGASDGGRHKLDILKSSVAKEYDDNPADADELMALFDTLARNWDFILSYGDVEDLNEFLVTLGTQAAPRSSIDVSQFLGNLNVYRRKEIPASSYSELLEATGFLTDAVKSTKDGKSVVYKVSEYTKGIEVFLSKGPASIKRMMDLLREGDSFAREVVPAFSKFTTEHPIGDYFFLVGKESFHKRLDTVTVTLGGEKVITTLKETHHYEGKRVMVCEATNSVLAYDIYCVS